LIATILDGAMTNCLFARGIRAPTAELHGRYRAPEQASEELRVTARMQSSQHGLFALRAEITQAGAVKATATGKFMQTHE
jgi:acyl-CoA thioesterase FadM